MKLYRRKLNLNNIDIISYYYTLYMLGLTLQKYDDDDNINNNKV